LSRWRIPEVQPPSAQALAAAVGIHLPAARVLAARGFDDPAAARRFLNPSLDDLHDPFLMLGMRDALDRLRRACAGGEKILLYGDYDVDGTTSVVILKTAIHLAGGRAGYHIPHRLRDGYGMRPEVIDVAAADGVNLIVSLDTGIRAAETVRYARERGIDVIVTDHHVPDADIPPACAVLNPKQPGCGYPDKDLCGAGVALKLVQALLASLDWPAARLRRMIESFVRPVAIATVADVVPLMGENRVLVKFGLAGLGAVRNPGLKALLSVAGIADGDAPSAGQVAFRIAPRLNAAGRMADARDIVNLLLTTDDEEARRLAAKLDELNRERQGTEDEIVRAILAACLEAPVTERDFGLVFAGAGWHRGVIGIVANRLVERFHRPVIVLSEDAEEGIAHGSGRSIPGFDLLDALESMPELFLRFGGHRQAAGLALNSGRIAELRERFNSCAAARLTPQDLEPEVRIDAVLEFSEISEESVAEVLALAPFGCGNPAPVFAVRGVEVLGEPALLKERHLRVNLRQNGRTLTLKSWNSAARIAELRPGDRVDAAVCFEPDEYSAARGYPGWCAVLKDFRKSACASA
jgi:single-stranded-DNA-specific exonuclease